MRETDLNKFHTKRCGQNIDENVAPLNAELQTQLTLQLRAKEIAGNRFTKYLNVFRKNFFTQAILYT